MVPGPSTAAARPGTLKRWQLTAGTAVPIIIAVIIGATLVSGFVLWATRDLDSRSLGRESRLISHIIAEQIAKVPHDQESITIWDDAIRHTVQTFDPDWIDLNMGSWMARYFGHDRVFILDAANRPRYAMDKSAPADPSDFAGELNAIQPLAAKLRTMISAGALDDYERGTATEIPRVSDVVMLGETPGIVSVQPIISNSGSITQARGTEFLHVTLVFLDEAYAARIAQQYLLENAHFTRARSGEDGQAAYPIMSQDGRFIAFFEWRPDRPGQLTLMRTAPALGAGFLIGGIVLYLLLAQLFRSAAALRAGRLSAQHLATHDSLTGLPNRAEFEARLAAALGRDRPADQRVALLMLDLDRFKQVNDTLGHQAGDDLIRAVSQRLREIVDHRDILARIGGDEFAVIHLTRSGERGAMQLSNRIIAAIARPFDVSGAEAFVGMSIGVAVEEPGKTARLELIRQADIALYEAKGAGRNRALVFEDAMNELLQGRHTIESELRDALRRGDQLSVAFQPLFSRETGRIKGAEALARWVHPTLGHISPARFIPVAEASGLIERLGEVILREACTFGANWPGQTIAVNISPSQLRNPMFPTTVFELLSATGMRASDLELEITEGVLLEESEVVADALSGFRAAGIRIALDDFGTGYSSLNYVKRYPVDCIKIDRSFVSQLAPGGVTVAIVQAMVTLAHALNIEVTAEGVETHEQMAILSEMGCNTFQGFLLSTPVAAAVLEAMLRGHEDHVSAAVA